MKTGEGSPRDKRDKMRDTWKDDKWHEDVLWKYHLLSRKAQRAKCNTKWTCKMLTRQILDSPVCADSLLTLWKEFPSIHPFSSCLHATVGLQTWSFRSLSQGQTTIHTRAGPQVLRPGDQTHNLRLVFCKETALNLLWTGISLPLYKMSTKLASANILNRFRSWNCMVTFVPMLTGNWLYTNIHSIKSFRMRLHFRGRTSIVK